jgi:hypothetical protein
VQFHLFALFQNALLAFTIRLIGGEIGSRFWVLACFCALLCSSRVCRSSPWDTGRNDLMIGGVITWHAAFLGRFHGAEFQRSFHDSIPDETPSSET